MTEWLEPGPGMHALKKALRDELRTSLVALLEKKHLYQSVDMNVSLMAHLRHIADRILPMEEQDTCLGIALTQFGAPWFVLDVPGRQLPLKNRESVPKAFTFEPPSVNLFCDACDRIQAFNPASAAELFGGFLMPKVEKPSTRITQTFTLSFQCQSCKGEPEALLVRREGLKLTLCGRAPIERVDVPKSIPKGAASKYFGQAVVAYDAGYVLAGLFYLRVMIEQYAVEEAKKANQSVSGPKGDPPRAFDFIDAYTEGLDEDLKKRTPSFRRAYEVLSEAIHNADESAELFESVRKQIEQHFVGKEWLRNVGKGA